MSDTNSVSKVTSSDLERYQKIAQGNSVTAMRISYEQVNRRLGILQQRLNDLQSAVNLVKNKIYNMYDIATINDKFKSNKAMTIKPVQSYAFADIDFEGPHQSVSYDLNQLDLHLPGILELKKEVDRLNAEIQTVSANIRQYNELLKTYKEKLAANEAKNSGTTEADLAADKAQRSRYATMFYLFQMHEKYRELTTDQDKKRNWPDNQVKVVKDLMALQQVFRAHALSLGDISKQMNLIDPGADENATILKDLMNKLQKSMGDVGISKVEDQVKKYMASVQTTTQNAWLSKGISRKEVPDPPKEDSLNEATQSYSAAMINFFGNTYNVGFTLPSALEMVTKWWKKKIKNNYVGLPPCNPPQLSEAEAQQQELEANQKAAESKGSELVGKSDTEATDSTVAAPLYKNWWDYFINAPEFKGKNPQYGYVPNYVVFPGSPDDRRWLVTTGIGSGQKGEAEEEAAKADDAYCIKYGFSTEVKSGKTTIPTPWDLQDRVFSKISVENLGSEDVPIKHYTYKCYSLRYVP